MTDRPKGSESPSSERKREDMTPEERLDLLAQIDRAAQRVQATSRIFAEAEQALRDGRTKAARAAIDQLRAANPRLEGLAELEARLRQTEGVARRRERVAQAEEMLERYLKERKQSLAELALETLLDLYPNHPKRSDYEAWVQLLGDEVAQQEAAEEAYREARAAVAAGEVRRARRQLDRIEKLDQSGELADRLREELREAETSRRTTAEVEEVRSRLEERLASGALAEAEAEVERLARLGIPRVTLDGYRTRLEELRARRQSAAAVREFEDRYAERLEASDWYGAREVVEELERELPDSPRPQQMFAEISHLEERERRRQALDEGLRAFEGYLGANQLGQAEVAVKVLRGLAPDDPRVRQAAARLEALRE